MTGPGPLAQNGTVDAAGDIVDAARGIGLEHDLLKRTRRLRRLRATIASSDAAAGFDRETHLVDVRRIMAGGAGAVGR